MTDSSPRPDRLTQLQHDLLAAFFARNTELFLTGGAALAGYWLGHRDTDDLDLFGFPEANLERAVRSLLAAASEVGATLQAIDSHTDFRRFLAERAGERCKVDLVIDRAPVVERQKARVDGIRVDTMREIAANKLCALVGRSEVRDLVDLKCLLEAGIDLDRALRDAQSKDGGAEAATLGWLLSQLAIGPNAKLPGGVDPSALALFRDSLVVRLRAIAAGVARRSEGR